jgi:hypothetical protein
MDFREKIILEDENNPDNRNILPMDPIQLFDYIKDGSVLNGKVILVLSRDVPDNYFTDKYEFQYDKNRNESIYNSKADIVVFYCNHGSENSPRLAEYYQK